MNSLFKKGIALFVFVILSSVVFAQVFTPFPGDGAFNSMPAGPFPDAFTPLDPGAFPDTFTPLNPGAFPDTFTPLNPGAFPDGFTPMPGQTPDTAQVPNGNEFGGNGFGNGFEFIPFPTTPMGPNSPPFTNDLPARWNNLHDVSISQGTGDNTLIYPGIANECDDPDTPELVTLASGSPNYRLFLDGPGMRIAGLLPLYLGTEQVTLSCNGVTASFWLSVVASQNRFNEPEEQSRENLEVSIGAIALPDQNEPGAFVPVIVSFRNTGDDKLENIHVRVSLPDLGVMSASTGPFDLSEGKRTSQTLILELPEAMEIGYYAARVTIDSGSLHRIVHRDLVVE